MPNHLQFDVFLSHSAKDKVVVRPLAERLPKDRPAFQAFSLQPFPNAPVKGSLAQFLYINWLPRDYCLRSFAPADGGDVDNTLGGSGPRDQRDRRN
jgi:hypothetical protein